MVEGKINQIQLIGHSVVIGDKKKFLTALITINHETIDSYLDTLGIDKKDREPTLYKLLSEGRLNNNSIKKTAIPHLDIITANIELAASEVELVDIEERESRLKKILDEIYDESLTIMLFQKFRKSRTKS